MPPVERRAGRAAVSGACHPAPEDTSNQRKLIDDYPETVIDIQTGGDLLLRLGDDHNVCILRVSRTTMMQAFCYFQNLFSGSWTESEDRVVTLPEDDVPVDAMMALCRIAHHIPKGEDWNVPFLLRTVELADQFGDTGSVRAAVYRELLRVRVYLESRDVLGWITADMSEPGPAIQRVEGHPGRALLEGHCKEIIEICVALNCPRLFWHATKYLLVVGESLETNDEVKYLVDPERPDFYSPCPSHSVPLRH